MKANKMMYTLLVVSTLSVGAAAQNQSGSYFSNAASIMKANHSKVEKQYSACLKSGNDGVVESALAHVAMLKLVNPERDFGTLASCVDFVAGSNKSGEIRYKAYLVSSVLRNPELFAADARAGYESPDELFAALSSRLSALVAERLEK